MKTKLLLLLTGIICGITNAQVDFQLHLITNQIILPSSVFPIDLDNDGDLDILSTSYNDSEVVWSENTDGLGTFGGAQLISNSMNTAIFAIGADLDNDNDNDVVSGSFDKIAWYANNGNGTFGSQQEIDVVSGAAWSIDLKDLDDDGDIDILVPGGFSSIVWYENTDGAGSFSSANNISNAVDTPLGVYAQDLDGDGDLDVLSASKNDNKIAWYENTNGSGLFGTQQIISTNATSAYDVKAVDLDGDGDSDVLTAQEFNSNISWFENLDGNGNFGPAIEISSAANQARYVHFGDLDADGDMDILSASRGDNKIAWYQNDGSGNFGVQIIINDNAFLAGMVYVEDIDLDGDIDVMSSDFGNVNWYENLSPLDIDENNLIDFSVYPIPTTGILTVQSNTTIVQIEIYNPLGQLVLSNTNENQIDISSVSQGVYFIKIKDENGNFGTKKIVKK